MPILKEHKNERLYLEKQLDIEKLNPELLKKFNELVNLRDSKLKK